MTDSYNASMKKDSLPALKPAGRARGGAARAAALTDEEREMAARRAANARWKKPSDPTISKATHMGVLNIGDIQVVCAVLEDGKRVITQRAVLHAIGRTRLKGSRFRTESDAVELPPFLTAKNLEPFISSQIVTASKPVVFKLPGTGRYNTDALGYQAELLPEICRVFVKARQAGQLSKAQEPVADRCELLLAGLATVGIIAMVDEATGFQAERTRDELQAILAAYVSPELLPWTKRFPDIFYEEMFRLLGWSYNPPQIKKPKLISKLTDELIYKRLPPGIREELKRKNPPDAKGRRKNKNFQHLTDDIGNIHLERQILATTTLMKASQGNRKLFNQLYNAAFPLPGQQLSLGIEDEDLGSI
jgi:hypothetical protein